MSDISEKEFSIIDILTNEPKDPFSINLNIKTDNGTTEELFLRIKNIFLKGLIIQSGNGSNDTINIKDINLEHMDIMKRHMLSMGIDVKFKKYSSGTKDCLFRNLLYDIQHIKNIDIKVIMDWNTDLIEKITINLKIKNGDISVLQTYQNILKRHFEANHFLKLSKPELLKDFAILVEDDNDVSVVYFDFAKRSSIEHIHKYIVNAQFV